MEKASTFFIPTGEHVRSLLLQKQFTRGGVDGRRLLSYSNANMAT
jgi:hypothetical protein